MPSALHHPTGYNSEISPNLVKETALANPLEFPFQVRIHYEGEFLCTGAIISPLLILTAANCLFGKQKQNVQVFAGEYDNYEFGRNEQDRSVSKIIFHNEYDSDTRENNLAILEVVSPFVFTPHVGQVNFWTTGLSENDIVTSSYSRRNGEIIKTDIHTISMFECAKHYENQPSIISPNNICTEASVRCSDGDVFGGLLTRDGLLVAIESVVRECNSMRPTVYTDVSKYVAWIDNSFRKYTNFTNDCSLNEFYCKADGSCISSDYICDGERDCIDGFDEEETNCSCKGKLICKTDRCINPEFKCDQEWDCPQGEDELNCSK